MSALNVAGKLYLVTLTFPTLLYVYHVYHLFR